MEIKGVSMTEEKEYFEQIRKLCVACGISVDKIAKQFNKNQNMVAQLFIDTFQKILKEM